MLVLHDLPDRRQRELLSLNERDHSHPLIFSSCTVPLGLAADHHAWPRHPCYCRVWHSTKDLWACHGPYHLWTSFSTMGRSSACHRCFHLQRGNLWTSFSTTTGHSSACHRCFLHSRWNSPSSLSSHLARMIRHGHCHHYCHQSHCHFHCCRVVAARYSNPTMDGWVGCYLVWAWDDCSIPASLGSAGSWWMESG